MSRRRLVIENCKACPHLKVVPTITGDSFEHERSWHCYKSGMKKIAGCISWSSEEPITIPDWCELERHE